MIYIQTFNILAINMGSNSICILDLTIYLKFESIKLFLL